MLKQRIVTALVLLALLLPALASDQVWPFAALTLVLIGAAGWEWGRLNGLGMPGALLLGACLALACGAAWAAGWTEHTPSWIWWLATGAWVLGGAAALRAGPVAWPRVPTAARLGLGLVVLWAAWLAVSHAKVLGLGFILSVFCLVWAADIAAYFGGRRFGKRKLAPSISPGKSWEGVYSGMAGVLLLTALWLWMDPGIGAWSGSVFARLWAAWGALGTALSVLALVGMSVVGDLVESLVKRAAGAKDSSALLPGHGGVLDRVDALLPVFPMAMALAQA